MDVMSAIVKKWENEAHSSGLKSDSCANKELKLRLKLFVITSSSFCNAE